MNRRSSFRVSLAATAGAFLLAAVFLLTTLPLHAADTTSKLRNQQVDVTESTLQPGQSLSLTGHLPSVIVYFQGDVAALGAAIAAVHRGQTVFVPAALSSIRDTGSSPLQFVRVAFLGSGDQATWGRTGLPPNYTVLFENRYTRTYDIKIPAGFREPRHTHHGRVVICLSGAKLEHLLPSGQIQPSSLTTGEVVWRPGQTHVGHNIGSTNLWVIAVEPK